MFEILRRWLLLSALATAALTSLVACDDADDEGICAEDREIVGGETLQLSATKILVEHNATDEDTGFQIFADGDPWHRLRVTGPGGRVLTVLGPDHAELGLTEMFFETREPENLLIPIDTFLATLPEGPYRFEAEGIDGNTLTGEATLTHDVPAGPVIIGPEAGATVDPQSTVVSWEPVTTTIDGQQVEIVAYQLIVEEILAEGASEPAGFSKPVLSVHVGPSTTRVTLPPEFLRSGTEYRFEVLALEISGNQTLTSSEFQTE